MTFSGAPPCVAPERGFIGVFNRSYYEAVLITRVHPKLLHSEGYGRKPRDLDAFFAERLVSIQNYERHLQACGTKIVKIFLHVSPEEQRKRLLERLDDPEKTWKASLSDVAERKHFKDYWRAYEAVVRRDEHAATRPGTSFPPTTNTTRGCSPRRSWSKRWNRSISKRSRSTRSAAASSRRSAKG